MRRVLYRQVANLRVHPLAELVPAKSQAELQRLREDMRDRGLEHPLWITRDDQVVDGRHRLTLARSLGWAQVPVRLLSKSDEADLEGFVLRSALTQKHLSDDQRAVLAVEWQERRKSELQRAAGRHAIRCRLGRFAPNPYPKRDSWREAMALFAVPERKMRLVKRLKEKAPSWVERIRAGELGLLEALRQNAIAGKREAKALRQAQAQALPPMPELLLGDAADILPSLPDGTFSLLCTDPPWGGGYRASTRVASDPDAIANDESVEQAVQVFEQVLAAAKPKMQDAAKVLVFLPWRHEWRFRQIVEQQGFRAIEMLYWIKEGPTFFPGRYFGHQCVQILYAARGDPRIHPLRSNVFIQKRTRKTDHLCENPVNLLMDLIACTTVLGEAVLDPFAGSGSCVEAALRLGRRAVGIELEAAKYYEARLRLHQSIINPEAA